MSKKDWKLIAVGIAVGLMIALVWGLAQAVQNAQAKHEYGMVSGG